MTKTILVADDSKTMQRCVELTFQATGFRVVCAGTAQETLTLLERTQPDLVLADSTLNGTDGYQLCQQIKSNSKTAQIPVLLLTGNKEAVDEGRVRAARADGSIKKPFETQNLIDQVKRLTGVQVEGGGPMTFADTLLAKRSSPPPPDTKASEIKPTTKPVAPVASPPAAAVPPPAAAKPVAAPPPAAAKPVAAPPPAAAKPVAAPPPAAAKPVAAPPPAATKPVAGPAPAVAPVAPPAPAKPVVAPPMTVAKPVPAVAGAGTVAKAPVREVSSARPEPAPRAASDTRAAARPETAPLEPSPFARTEPARAEPLSRAESAPRANKIDLAQTEVSARPRPVAEPAPRVESARPAPRAEATPLARTESTPSRPEPRAHSDLNRSEGLVLDSPRAETSRRPEAQLRPPAAVLAPVPMFEDPDDFPIEEPELLEDDDEALGPSGPRLEPPRPPPEGLQVASNVDVWDMPDEDEEPLRKTNRGSALAGAVAQVAPKLAGPIADRAGQEPLLAGLPREELIRIATETIERVVWEVVPELAETLIQQELKRLLSER